MLAEVRRHQDERNEYELLTHERGQIATRIIDRMFLEDNYRWIIDFKTGKDNDHSLQHHQQEVNDYAKLLTLQGAPNVRCGIYYLATNH
ncbi:MAG: hypothetical protein HYX60_07100 [Legionella longbeachae]|nr:hypothetical protein [Legionella longbeachae]